MISVRRSILKRRHVALLMQRVKRSVCESHVNVRVVRSKLCSYHLSLYCYVEGLLMHGTRSNQKELASRSCSESEKRL